MMKLVLSLPRAQKLIQSLKDEANIEIQTVALENDVIFQIPKQHEAVFFRYLNDIIDQENEFWLETYDQNLKVYPSSCLYFEAMGHEVVLINNFYKSVLLRHSLGEIEEKLSDLKFMRISKSVIVNLDKIIYVKPLLNSKIELSLPGQIKLEVNRSYIKAFKIALREKGGL